MDELQMKEPQRSAAHNNAIAFSNAMQVLMHENDTEVLWTWRGLMKMTVILYDFRNGVKNGEIS